MFSFIKILKKGYLPIVIMLLAILLLAGCSQGGSYKIIMGDIHTGDNYIKGSYSKFSGNYYKKLKLDKNDEINLKLSAETNAGSITAQLINPDGNKILELKEGTKKKKIINDPGQYKFKVIGEKHKGDFEFKWERK